MRRGLEFRGTSFQGAALAPARGGTGTNSTHTGFDTSIARPRGIGRPVAPSRRHTAIEFEFWFAARSQRPEGSIAKALTAPAPGAGERAAKDDCEHQTGGRRRKGAGHPGPRFALPGSRTEDRNVSAVVRNAVR